MQTGSINGSGDWARFMQLTSEARMRNEALAQGRGVRRTTGARRMPAVAFEAPKAVPHSVQSSAKGPAYAATQPMTTGRILGGKFDAYA